MKEFNLSKKRRYCGCGNKNMYYKEEDVKEFIKRLKEKINPKKEIINEFCCPCCMLKKELLNEIDKLAGEKLI